VVTAIRTTAGDYPKLSRIRRHIGNPDPGQLYDFRRLNPECQWVQRNWAIRDASIGWS
jgi:hypothetical protein